jgi:polyketide biosynthesis enoyl-CoA hydratase PksH
MNTYRLVLPTRLGAAEVAQLSKAIHEACFDRATRSITLVGSGHLFVGGLDLAALVGREKPTVPSEQRAILGGLGRLLLLLRSAPKPTLALVDGAVLGSGTALAAACDVVLCTERASFAFPEIMLGSIPCLALPFLRERVSEHHLRLWLMCGMSRGAEAALVAGLADAVVSSTALEREYARWLRRLGRIPLRAVTQLKRERLPALTKAVGEAEDAMVGGLAAPEVRRAVLGFANQGNVPWEDE